MKSTKHDGVQPAIYRTTTDPTPTKVGAAKWLLYGAAAITTTLMFAAEVASATPKLPPGLGD